MASTKDDNKVRVIEYIDGHTFDEEGIAYPTIKKEPVIMSNTKRYYNCLYMLAGIKLLPRLLMDWLTEEMDDNNIVYNSAYTRERFIEFIDKITLGKQKYQDQSVRQAFSDLKESGLIIPKNKGAYRVNPKYFFKGGENQRIELIMLEIKLNSTNTNFRVINHFKK
jgi:hypothetical protein